jgi:predicted polyphosphate/ATP-dependent NAD kinase
MVKKMGLIINPMAGIGGRVGLKGSDGEAIQKKAIDLGAVPGAEKRAIQALERLKAIKDKVNLVTYPGEMGESAAKNCGFDATVIGTTVKGKTTAEDTRQAAIDMMESGVALLLFAGGDGTARDIYEAIGSEFIVVGIPAGVKIHSAVYARNPFLAGDLVVQFLQGKTINLREVEVMDIDEVAFRNGALLARLYGYLKTPYQKRILQGLKSGSAPNEAFSQEGIAAQIIDLMRGDVLYIIGPGTTTRAITDRLGLRKTLLGVDVLKDQAIVADDVNEEVLLKLTEGSHSKIIITPIGGQGFLLGRGNQQISPEVIRNVGVDNIIVVSTTEKINSLRGRPFLVDTGDRELDNRLSRHIKVITGYNDVVIYKLSA